MNRLKNILKKENYKKIGFKKLKYEYCNYNIVHF